MSTFGCTSWCDVSAVTGWGLRRDVAFPHYKSPDPQSVPVVGLVRARGAADRLMGNKTVVSFALFSKQIS